MANQQGQRQDEREATTMAKSGDGGERGLATRQYQDPLSMLDSLFERMLRCGTLTIESAGEHGQVVLPEVPRVELVQREVYRCVEAETRRLGSDRP